MRFSLVCLLLLLSWSAVAARPRSNTQRSFFPSQPQLFVDDLTGDGIDEWIPVDQQAMFIVDADFYARGRAYTRTPDNSTIATVVSGAFLGKEQPRVACAVAPSTGGQTNISCGILHTSRFEFDWIIPPHTLPFAVNNISARQTGGVDLIVGDFDGDGKDELLTYYPAVGTFASYSLASSSSGQLRFTLQLASIPIIDNVPLLASTSPMKTVKQSVHVGNVFGSPSFSSGSNGAQCVGYARPLNRTILLPPEQLSSEPIIPDTPIDLKAQPKRTWDLDAQKKANTQVPDSLILVDPSSGAVQGFSACVQSKSVEFHRILVTPSGVVPSDAQVSLAAVQGLEPFRDELVIYRSAGTSPTSRLAVYSSSYDTIHGGALHRVALDSGDLARAMKVYRGTRSVELAWMRSRKPRVIRPKRTEFAEAMANDAAEEPSFELKSFALPSAESSSFFRMDPVLLLPPTAWSTSSASRMLQFVATFVSGSPADRDETLKVNAESDSVKEALKSAASSTSSTPSASAPFGVRTYRFSFSQFTLDLDGDPDGDAIRTRHELGGLDTNLDGVSDEPLHSHGASPFLRDVFVEIDYMADEAKSMRPREGFDGPAKEDLREHGIVLHAFVDEAIPRVEDLGPSGTFSWDQHLMPLKAKYFTPSRIGLFHYCLFLDKFNSGSVSGQSRSVPGTEFFVSLGGWNEGRGSLMQQQGTFLHELGHQLNLLHGGNDDVNWKPNHLSVMNYAYQVIGVQEDGTARIALSDIDCSDLDEGDLNEFTGIVCRGRPIDQGRNFSTLIDGKWHTVNQQVDFNEDGKIEGDVAYDLNGDSLSVLSGSPNEFSRMRFDGLELVPGFRAHANGETPEQHSARSSRQLLEAEQPVQRELSFDDLTRMALGSSSSSSFSAISLLERASAWLGALAFKSS